MLKKVSYKFLIDETLSSMLHSYGAIIFKAFTQQNDIYLRTYLIN